MTTNHRTERLLEALGAISRTTFSGSEQNEEYIRGNLDAHATCARMARAAIKEYMSALSRLGGYEQAEQNNRD